MEDLKKIQEFFSKPLEENTFKKGDKVTYLGNPAEITFVGKDQMDRTYYSVSYDKGNGKTKASNLYNKDGEIKAANEMDANDPVLMKKQDLKEFGSSDMNALLSSMHINLGYPKEFPGLSKIMDAAGDATDFYMDDFEEYSTNRDELVMSNARAYARREFPDFMAQAAKFIEPVDEAIDANDPVLMKMRAAKDKLAKMRAANAGDDGNDKFFDNAKKIAFLKKERERLMRDMEQEAEPEGGPIADEYGSKLNRIDKAIAKLSGRKEMTYDQAIAEDKSLKKGDIVKFKDGSSIYILGPKGDGYDYKDGQEKGHHPKGWFDMMISSGKAVVAEMKVGDKVTFKSGGDDMEIIGVRDMFASDLKAYRVKNADGETFEYSEDQLQLAEGESKMPTQDQVDKFFALTQNETHYLNSKPVAGQEATFNLMKIEPWDEYDLSNWNSLVRKAKSKGKLLDEDNSYARVSMPRFKKDKNNPNFLNVYIDYDLGPGGASIAFGKETMTGQIRRLSAAKAMRLAGDVARDLEAEYNLEDIEITDLENGKVRIFAVSDDFINMDPNMLGENTLLKQAKLSSAEYQKAKKLKDFNKDNYKWNPDESLYVKLNEAKRYSTYEIRMVNQIRRAKKDGEPMYNLPLATQNYYRKNKAEMDALVAKEIDLLNKMYDEYKPKDEIDETYASSFGGFKKELDGETIENELQAKGYETPSTGIWNKILVNKNGERVAMIDTDESSYTKDGKSYQWSGTEKFISHVESISETDDREDDELSPEELANKYAGSPFFKENLAQTLAETIKLGEGVIEEELCPKGKAYIKRRKAAGEKSSAYLSGRAVKVCKGQMSGRKKKK